MCCTSHAPPSSLRAQHPQKIGEWSIYLRNRGLNELPDEVWSKPKARRLLISRNALTVLPGRLATLRELRELDISYNEIEALPPALLQLTKLTRLQANNNYITAVPPTLARLTALQARRPTAVQSHEIALGSSERDCSRAALQRSTVLHHTRAMPQVRNHLTDQQPAGPEPVEQPALCCTARLRQAALGDVVQCRATSIDRGTAASAAVMGRNADRAAQGQRAADGRAAGGAARGGSRHCEAAARARRQDGTASPPRRGHGSC